MKKLIRKIKVRGRDEFEEKVAKLGVDFGPLFWQHDRIYIPRGYKRGQNFPRFIMRTEMKAVDRPASYYLILKRHIEESGIEIENVTMIKDYTEAVEMIMQLGFTLYGEVSRKRQAAKVDGETELFMDKIEGLNGVFVKVETKISEGKKLERIKEEIEKLTTQLEEKNYCEKTYAELLK